MLSAFTCECCERIFLRVVSGETVAEWELSPAEAHNLGLELQQALADQASRVHA